MKSNDVQKTAERLVVAHDLAGTSVEDMQSGLWNYNDVDLLLKALRIVTRRGEKTKAKILGVKIRKLKKAAEKERKLLLIQKAYD